MKLKTVFILTLVCLTASAGAINYPEYRGHRQLNYLPIFLNGASENSHDSGDKYLPSRSTRQEFSFTNTIHMGYPQEAINANAQNLYEEAIVPIASIVDEDVAFSGNASAPAGGPRRAVDGAGNGTPDETWTYNGVSYGRDTDGTFYMNWGAGWRAFVPTNPGDIGYSYSPIGDATLPLLFMAMALVGLTYLRRRKARAQ